MKMGTLIISLVRDETPAEIDLRDHELSFITCHPMI